MTEDSQSNDQSLSEGQRKFEASIAENAGKDIDPKVQEELNKPFSDSSTSLSGEDQDFLNLLMEKVDNKEIDLHTPSSIINQEVYDELSGEQQSQTDLFINSTLFLLRQVYDFYHSEHDNNSDMMINMVQELRLKIETLERELGDVLKI